MGGTYASKNFTYIKIDVFDCSTTSGPSLGGWTPTCAPTSEIKSTIDSSGAINFQFYFSNTITNPDNIDAFDKYLNDELFFPFIPKIAGVTQTVTL